jgi:tetratricopeptide (TPR) repeat protein
MSWLDWFRPSPEKRLTRAQRALEMDDPAAARDELDGLEGPPYDAIRSAALDRLVTRNLEQAVAWSEAGDDERVRVHLELADEHHEGGREADFRETRRKIREHREERDREADARRRLEEARAMQVDPRALKLSESALGPLLAEDAEERRMRVELAILGYPEDLRAKVPELGPEFAQAVLDLADGRADLALQALLVMPDEVAIVRLERARCALMLGDPRAAVRELRAFANLAGGHRAVGQEHSGVLLASALAESQDPHGAVRVLRDVQAREPQVGLWPMAQLLFATGQLAEADDVLRGLIAKYPTETPFYLLLAHVRVALGQRVPAMRALEQSLHACACTAGTCGAKAPDPAVKRFLAALYLEDGVEVKRALQLLDEAPVDGAPAWDDLYVDALAAKVRGEVVVEKVQRLKAYAGQDDTRLAKVRERLEA